MSTKEKTQEKLVKVPEKSLLSLVAAKLKNRTLFPKRVEEAENYLKNAKAI